MSAISDRAPRWSLCLQTLLVAGVLVGLVLPVSAAPVGDPPPPTAPVQEQLDWFRAKIKELEDLAKAQAAKKSPRGNEKVKVSGYVQAQVASDQAASPQTDFRIRRSRIKLAGPISPNAAFAIQLDASSTVTLKDAYIDLIPSGAGWRLRIGQDLIPFEYEVLESDATRLEPERTQMAGVFFPSERDIGAWVQFSNPHGMTVDAGVMNGNGPNNKDNNDNKTVLARVRVPLGGKLRDPGHEANSVYVAVLSGDFTKDSTTASREAIGVGISYLIGRLLLQGEFLSGDEAGKDVTGWYAHVALPLQRTEETLFFRIEAYDEDTDTPDTTYRGLVIGIQHDVDGNTRIVLAHEFRDPDAGFSGFGKLDGDATTLRVQVKF